MSGVSFLGDSKQRRGGRALDALRLKIQGVQPLQTVFCKKIFIFSCKDIVYFENKQYFCIAISEKHFTLLQ